MRIANFDRAPNNSESDLTRHAREITALIKGVQSNALTDADRARLSSLQAELETLVRDANGQVPPRGRPPG